MNKYKEGDIVKVEITAIEKYGAFAKIDDFHSGLIHISEITNGYVKNISDFLDIGDIVNAQILEFSSNNELKFSIKDLNGNLFKLKNKKIKETLFGFYLLKSALPTWIDKKIEEIDKKN